MHNDTRIIEINQDTGQITNEYVHKAKGSYYFGPRKYERIMEMFNEMLIKFSGKVGVKFILFMKDRTTMDYKLEINNMSKLARDLDVDRSRLVKIINQMVQDNYIKRINKTDYAVNPDLFWLSGVEHTEWQEMKKAYNLWNSNVGKKETKGN